MGRELRVAVDPERHPPRSRVGQHHRRPVSTTCSSRSNSFWDPELETDLGELGRGEAFGDNTSAWSLDGFAVGLAALKAHSGSEAIRLTVVEGGADGRGFTFGEDVEVIDGVEVHFERRYKHGDIMTVWDDGVVIEKHVSNVKITEQEDGRMRTVTTFGDAITVGDGWERVLKEGPNDLRQHPRYRQLNLGETHDLDRRSRLARRCLAR